MERFVTRTTDAARPRLSLGLVALTVALGCGGGPPRSAQETAAPRSEGGEPEASAARDEAPIAAERPTAEVAAPETPPPPPLPQLTARDPHTRVIGQLQGRCAVDGVDGGHVYVGVSDARESSLVRFSLAGGAPEVLHRVAGTVDYRVAGGQAAYAEITEGFGVSNFGSVPLDGGPAVELAHGVHQSTWALGPGGIYFADSSYSEPRVMRVSHSGGAPVEIEEVRPVFDEDQLEHMIASNGELVFVAVRTRNAQRGGYFCHELRGGPAGVSETLRRYRRCPSDDEILDALSVSPAFVYYHRAEGLYRIARRPGGREETIIADVRGVPTATASDDRYLLWPQREGLLRLAIGERAVPEVIGEPAQALTAPVIAEGVVYWARREASQSCVVLGRPIDAPALSPWEPSSGP